MSEPTCFPAPEPEYGAEAYWAACNEERLEMQCCAACGRFRWHPAPLCTYCGDDRYSWRPLSGRAYVHTWTIVTHPVHPAAVDRVPYIVAEVRLEEQDDLTMITNLVDIEPDAVTFDLPLEVAFEVHPGGQKLPIFRPR